MKVIHLNKNIIKEAASDYDAPIDKWNHSESIEEKSAAGVQLLNDSYSNVGTKLKQILSDRAIIKFVEAADTADIRSKKNNKLNTFMKFISSKNNINELGVVASTISSSSVFDGNQKSLENKTHITTDNVFQTIYNGFLYGRWTDPNSSVQDAFNASIEAETDVQKSLKRDHDKQDLIDKIKSSNELSDAEKQKFIRTLKSILSVNNENNNKK